MKFLSKQPLATSGFVGQVPCFANLFFEALKARSRKLRMAGQPSLKSVTF
jgi:hypothetical protein